MYQNNKILAIIPARGGSKSVPKKNIYPLNGKPLIYYSISSGLKAKYIDRLIVSTDSPEIAKVARKYKAEVPFLRPLELARDDSPDIEFYLHTLKWLADNEKWTPYLVLNLRPTSPLRTAELIDNCIKKVIDLQADGLKTVSLTDKHPHKMWRLTNDGWLNPFLRTKFRLEKGPDVRRQELEPIYWQNAMIDITKPKFILEDNKVFGDHLTTIITLLEDSVDLDNLLDFKIAEAILKNREN